MAIRHIYTSPQADGTDTSLVRPSDWNSSHAYTLPDGLSIGGNTSGVLTLINSGTVLFFGGNNVTLSQNGNSITISGVNTVSQTVQPAVTALGVSSVGNTSGNTGTTQGTVVLAGGNNVTLSQSTNASGATITFSAFNQTTQTQNLVDVTLAGNSTSAGAGYVLMSSGTVTLAGGNNVTLSQNGNAVTISAFNQTTQTQNLIDATLAGNSTSAGAGYILISSGTMTLAGGNNVTLSQNGNAVTISAFTQTVQTQNNVDATVAGNSTSAGAGYVLISSGTMTLAGGNNITLSQNGNAITISGPNAGGAQTGISGIAASNTTYTSGTVTITGVGGGVTVSSNTGQRIDISVAAQTVQTQNLHDVTLAGNSTSAGAGYILVSSGTMTLAGGNNVTLSQNGNAVTISAFTQTVQTQNNVDATIAGNSTSAGAGYVLISSGTMTLAGGNNVTLSQNGNAVTISAANTVAQSVQTQNCVDLSLSGNSTSAGAGFILISSGTAILAGGNNVTLSQNGQSVTISAASQTVQTQNCLDATIAGNSTSAGAGYVLMSSGTMTLAGGNNITLSQNGNAVTISAFTQSVQTQNLLVGGVSSIGNTAGNTGTVTGTLVFSGGANITLSQSTNASGATIGITGPTPAAGIDASIGGNSTSAGAGYILISTGTMLLAGGNNITLSENGNSITISAFTQTVQTQNCVDMTIAGNSTSAGAGYVLASSGTITLAGGNNITLSQNGNAVTISAFTQTVQTQNLFDLALTSAAGGATSGTMGTVSSGTLILAAGNNITLSQSTTNGITISALASSSLSATGMVSISTNGSTISIGAALTTAYSQFEPYAINASMLTNSTLSQNQIYIVPVDVPYYLSAYRVNMFVSIATVQSASAATGSAGYTMSGALYARDGGTKSTQMTSFWSGSWNINFSASSHTNISVTHPVGISNSTAVSTSQFQSNNAAASTYMANSVGGFRMVPMPISSSVTPGRYWFALANSHTSANASWDVNCSVMQQTLGMINGFRPFGTSSAASNASFYNPIEGMGTYSATTGAFPGTIAMNSDTIRAGTAQTIPFFNFSGYTTATNQL